VYSIGNKLKVSLFGKSHNECIGCIIEGLPRGMEIDFDNIREQMALRKPSMGIGTARKEDDVVIFEEGVVEGKVSSNSVLLKIMNRNTDSSSYSQFNTKPRPGHADLPALMKFKDFDVAGGAQFSGRMTAPLVAAGAIARQCLESYGIQIAAYTKQIHCVKDDGKHSFDKIQGSHMFRTRAIDDAFDRLMGDTIEDAAKEGDSVGGIVGCMVIGLPIGFGGIWFDALDVSIAKAMFSIPGAKGVEFGEGFGLAYMKGSQSNDQYCIRNGFVSASTNNMGGVCGGMSDGMPLTFNVAFKPTPSISKLQNTVNLDTMTDDVLEIRGRHDPCIVPRAVAVVEAMTALTILDQKMSFELDQ